MGGDGGSIPKRVELVRSRQKPEQVAKEAELAARWLHCQLSQERLQRPIVACQLGRMYNKTAALEFLLERDKFAAGGSADAFGHIRSLRDLRELRLADNPEYKPDDVTKGNASAYSHVAAPPFACPLSGVEMNGRFKFLFSWVCGCVLAEKAIERVGSGLGGSAASAACPVCQRPGAMADLVQMNPIGDAETAAAADAMSARRRRARPPRQGESSTASSSAASGKRKAGSTTVTAAATKVSRPSSSSTSTAQRPIGNNSGSRSIQNNPNASAALKSLFTSSKEAKAQEKAHWVTFNPGYFR